MKYNLNNKLFFFQINSETNGTISDNNLGEFKNKTCSNNRGELLVFLFFQNLVPNYMFTAVISGGFNLYVEVGSLL